MIVSPDQFLLHPDGRYEWTPDRVWTAWKQSVREVEAALPGVEALVLMVGLPGAGKSTWLAQNARAGVLYFDATLTRRSDRRPLLKLAEGAGRPVDGVWLDTPEALCRARNALRSADRRVPDEVVDRMARALARTPPAVAEGFRDVLRVGSPDRPDDRIGAS